jgi:heme exporter protein A
VQRGERILFEGLNLDLAAGQAVTLTGPNGAGKTSLLRVVAGFIAPLHGSVRFEAATGALEPGEARRADCHFLGHQDGLKTARTARDELVFWARWTGSSPAGIIAAAERMGVDRLLDLEVRQLSAGQRLVLARLIAAPRSLWLLDEPLSPLDGASRGLFGDIMAAHLDSGGLILAAAHDPLPMSGRELALRR